MLNHTHTPYTHTKLPAKNATFAWNACQSLKVDEASWVCFKIYLFLFYVYGILPSCMSVSYMYTVPFQRLEEGVRCPWDWRYRWLLALM